MKTYGANAAMVDKDGRVRFFRLERRRGDGAVPIYWQRPEPDVFQFMYHQPMLSHANPQFKTVVYRLDLNEPTIYYREI